MLSVFIKECLSISTTYHFQSEHIRPRLSPLCAHLGHCHMLLVVNVFLRLTPPLAGAKPLFATNKPSGRNEASQIYEHAENVLCLGGLLRPRSIKSMYISAPNGLRVNGLEEDKEGEEDMGGRCQCRLTPAD